MSNEARHFVSGAVWPAQRVARWTHHGELDYGPIRVEPEDARRFGGRMSSIPIGPITLTSIAVDDGGAVVTSLRDREGTPREHAFVTTLMMSGTSRYELDGQTICVGPGDVLVRDLLLPWKLRFDGTVHLLALRLPFDLVASRLTFPEALHGRLLERTSPEAALLAAVTMSAKRYADKGLPHWRATALVDLILSALQTLPATDSPQEPNASSTRIERAAIREMMRSFADPDLSTDILADRVGVHPRTLQRAFSARGRKIRQTLLDVRLDMAAEALRNPAQNPPSMTQLAFSHGFTDGAYFSRAFATRFGVPPTKFARTAGN